MNKTYEEIINNATPEKIKESQNIALECCKKIGMEIYCLDDIEPYLGKISPDKLKDLRLRANMEFMGACYTYGNAEYEGLPEKERRHAHAMSRVWKFVLDVLGDDSFKVLI